MDYFWNNVKQKKIDLSDIGHKHPHGQICGTGLPQTQPNGGQYLTFGQAYNSSEGAYVITQTLLLTAGKNIYFKNSGNDVLRFYYGKGCTELTITQLF
jgi:hypothetical protein